MIWINVGSSKTRLYQVNETGDVRSVHPTLGARALAPTKAKNGYRVVMIGSRRLYVHRLVAGAFIANPKDYPMVNHKDGDKDNNQMDNLEWCDSLHNVRHGFKHGLITSDRGERCHNAKLTEEAVLEIRKLLAEGISQRRIAEMFNVSRGPIDRISRGLGWRHVK